MLSLVETSGPSPTGHAGADRCPGALAVHQALDGGLVRIRVPGGMLPAPVFAALGAWSRELGNGRIELTGRGNLQLRGLRPGAEVELADRLARHDLLPSPAHDRARNVLASPLSGRDGLGLWDVRPLVGELDRRLCAAPELAALPGRFLFALDDGRGDVAGLGADAALLALPGGRAALLLGGQDSGLRVTAADAVAELLAVARAFLRVRGDERVWRVAELPGGPLSLLGRPSTAATAAPFAGSSAPEPPLRVPGRSSAGPVGRFVQRDGRVALGVGVPLGELDPDRCRVLAAGAAGEVVVTPWRGVLLPDLGPDEVGEVADRLAAAGLLVDPEAPLLAVTACTGRPGCGKALADVRADALATVPVASGDGPLHWSGCARRCGRPAGAADVVAEVAGYHVLRDGVTLGTGLDAAAVRDAVAGLGGVAGNATGGAGHVPGPAHLGPACAGSRTSSGTADDLPAVPGTGRHARDTGNTTGDGERR